MFASILTFQRNETEELKKEMEGIEGFEKRVCVSIVSKRGSVPCIIPSNLLKNIAISTANSKFWLVVEVDYLPSSSFDLLLTKSGEAILEKYSNLKQLFVIPSFETHKLENLDFLNSKEKLLKGIDSTEVRPRHFSSHKENHLGVSLDYWRNSNEIINSSKVHFNRADVPLVIVPNGLFQFDTSFSPMGEDTISFITEIRLANFSLCVFSEIYAVHVKEEKEEHWHQPLSDEQQIQFWKNWYNFLSQKFLFYGHEFSNKLFSKFSPVESFPQPFQLWKRIFLLLSFLLFTYFLTSFLMRHPPSKNNKSPTKHL